MPNLFEPVFEPPPADSPAAPPRAAIGRQAGARAFDASLYVLQPGQSVVSWPLPRAGEELLVVLEGSPSVRGVNGLRHLVAGDVLVCPAASAVPAEVENLTPRPARVLIIGRPALHAAGDETAGGEIGRADGIGA